MRDGTRALVLSGLCADATATLAGEQAADDGMSFEARRVVVEPSASGPSLKLPLPSQLGYARRARVR